MNILFYAFGSSKFVLDKNCVLLPYALEVTAKFLSITRVFLAGKES